MKTLLINFSKVIPSKLFNEYEYYYQIGSLNNTPQNKICLNNQELLNKIALKEKESYSNWVYSINKLFLKKDLILNNDLSLFFLADISNKRSELFDTYNNICNILLLKKIIVDNKINKILIYKGNHNFITSAKSFFDIKIHVLCQRKFHLRWIKNLLIINSFKHLRLIIRYLLYLIVLYPIIKKEKKQIPYCKTIFFTRYPLHFLEDAKLEEKYMYSVTNQDKFITNLNTDGLHQSLSIFDAFRHRIKIKKENNCQHIVVDDFVNIQNLLKSTIEMFWLYLPFRQIINQDFNYKKINISLSIKEELNLSYQRVLGLLICHRALKRLLKYVSAESYIYYLHEFCFGRMISYTLHQNEKINSIGMQHGMPSKRKLCFNLSSFEIPKNNKFNYLYAVPLPNKLLVEDNLSKDIYEDFGYKNIQIMKTIPRLSYLKNIKISNIKNKIIIIPGLHDFEMIYNFMIKIIKNSPKEVFYLKPHPRSKLDLNKFNFPGNVVITNQHISKLYSEAKLIYVTYSSVGYEAKKLKIPVKLIECPGKINESGLND